MTITSLTAPVVAASRRVRAVALLAALMIIGAAVSLNAQPASAASEYMTWGSANWSYYVAFQHPQFYCSPGWVGIISYGPTVYEPPNWGETDYIAMFGIQVPDGRGGWKDWSVKPLSNINGGIPMFPGSASQTFPRQLHSAGHGFYRMYLQVEIYNSAGILEAKIRYDANQASDYSGGYGVSYYCYI